MRQVINSFIPFGSFKALAMWPFLFIRGDKSFTAIDLRHEEIHGRQQREMLLFGFYIAYLVCWLKEMVHCCIDKERGQVQNVRYKRRNYWHRIAHSVIFEREAYAMQHDLSYLNRRSFWAWVQY